MPHGAEMIRTAVRAHLRSDRVHHVHHREYGVENAEETPPPARQWLHPFRFRPPQLLPDGDPAQSESQHPECDVVDQPAQCQQEDHGLQQPRSQHERKQRLFLPEQWNAQPAQQQPPQYPTRQHREPGARQDRQHLAHYWTNPMRFRMKPRRTPSVGATHILSISSRTSTGASVEIHSGGTGFSNFFSPNFSYRSVASR